MNKVAFFDTVKQKHLGKWIGVKENEVLVVSDSHDEVLRELAKKRIDDAYVFYSPTETEKQYSFLFLVCKWKLSNESSSAK